ncbi:cytochrome d ubiquinol oxidase subunit II [Flammeovirgaceae bacterium SG7u.111]|nr:cytochrome d ubiquinol oxidase subunit II [Flammeovirgaceae bacterium SG7u.132]WPO34601.1 cytochrome d ubiquinol oxidase subunit II [Flammeovirgaceae bacterium SG7u.111]
MIFTELVTLIMGISIVFYVIFGGADFGAGIIELFTGDSGNETISKAIAPVWEANHIWLIIAVVIMFNGFPEAYAVFSTALHIPILIALIGIIFRGAAFTFRHYDAFKDGSEKWYSLIFRVSSIVTVLFLGITVSAMFSGTIPTSVDVGFYAYFIAPWANLFSLFVGIFFTILSAYIAAIFLLGEVKSEDGYNLIRKFSYRLFAAAVVCGLFIFASSYYQELAFHEAFFKQPISLACGVLATVLVPFIFKLINGEKVWRTRLLAGIQITAILIGWLMIQYPNLILFTDGSTLSIYDASAPEITMKILFGALVFGVCSIFPSLYYLFRIFKIKI